MRLKCAIASIAAAMMVLVPGVFAGVPDSISYQGRLLDASSQPVTGDYSMTFSLYDAPTGGTVLWTEDHASVHVTDGLFSVEIGETVPLTADILAGSGGGGGGGAGGAIYLEVQLGGQPPMSPRTPLLSAPYSIAASRVSGDIQTASGQLLVRDNLGSSGLDGVSISADATTSRVTLNNIGSSGQDGVEIVADDTGRRLSMNNIGSSGQDGVEVKIEGNSRRLKLNNLGSSGNDGVELLTDGFSSSMRVSNIGSSGLDGVSITDDAASSSVQLARKRPGRVKYGTITLRAEADSVTDSRDCDSDDDGLTDSRMALTLGSGGGAGGLMLMEVDQDDDGVPETEYSQRLTPTTSNVAIKTKGTGADNNRISHTTYPDSAVQAIESDVDGDGVPESDISSIVTPTTSSVAIKTKGTGANDNGRVSVISSTSQSGASVACAIDLDGDGILDRSIDDDCDDAGARLAINSKGTSAKRTVACSTDESNSSVMVAGDLDGDGTDDCDATLQITPTMSSVAINRKGTGADNNRTLSVSSSTDEANAVHRCEIDDDGDMVPDQEIEQLLTPTTSSVAIKTKGTGANDNRTVSIISSTDAFSGSVVCATDFDADGVADRQISSNVDDTTAAIAIDEPGVQVAMGFRKGWDGTVKGRLSIDGNGASQVEFNSEGDGMVARRFGVGIQDPVNPLALASGAHCTPGGVWTNASDVNLKENFRAVDGRQLLQQIDQLNISQWNYKNESDNITHIGPTAQDFKAVFGVGDNDKSISTIDPSGIALAAIKELNKENQDLRNQLAEVKALLEKMLNEK